MNATDYKVYIRVSNQRGQACTHVATHDFVHVIHISDVCYTYLALNLSPACTVSYMLRPTGINQFSNP